MGRAARMMVLGAVLAVVAGAPRPVRALETDQWTPPKQTLAELGPELDLKMDLVLRMVANEANARLAEGKGEEVTGARANDFFARKIDGMLSNGIPECTIEKWIRHEPFPEQPARFWVPVDDSVYGGWLLDRPFTMIDLAPTIKLYGHYVGTDKVGHFFQQGHEYYEKFREAERRGKAEAECVRIAVEKGVEQENGIYGMLVVDVYSNADLAANLSGLMFYRNLTQAVDLGDEKLPALLTMRNGRWELNAYAGDDFMKHFVDDHWDEASNPSFYAPSLRHLVEENVRKMGGQWVAWRGTSRQEQERKLAGMTTWHGLHYGHSGYKDVITIVNDWYDRRPEGVVAAKR